MSIFTKDFQLLALRQLPFLGLIARLQCLEAAAEIRVGGGSPAGAPWRLSLMDLYEASRRKSKPYALLVRATH
jgi:hypothetical protein